MIFIDILHDIDDIMRNIIGILHGCLDISRCVHSIPARAHELCSREADLRKIALHVTGIAQDLVRIYGHMLSVFHYFGEGGLNFTGGAVSKKSADMREHYASRANILIILQATIR